MVRILGVLGILAAIAVAAFRPLEMTMPPYLELAGQLRAGPWPASFEPLGYPWLIALVPVNSLSAAAKTLHVFAYVALVIVVLRFAGDRPSLPMLAAVSWILFNPYVLVNIARLDDNNLNVPIALSLFLIMRIRVVRATSGLVAGAVLGAWTFIRPNIASLGLALVCANRRPPGSERAPHAVGFVTAVAAAAAVYASWSLIATGRPAFVPSNGPYNLFAGNNPSTIEAIVSNYNAEVSLPSGLAWCGLSPEARDATDADFLRCTARFIVDSPWQAVQTTIVKTYNLMWRPNLRLANTWFQYTVQFALLLPAWSWWTASALVLIRRRSVLDPAATVFVVAFALPYVLTNSEPRFRLPLDAIYCLSLATTLAGRAGMTAQARHAD